MGRLDVYPAPGKAASGYVVDVQSDLLSELATRVVAPSLRGNAVRAVASRPNPVLEIDGHRHVLIAQSIATVPRRELRRAAGSLANAHITILVAIDFTLTGF